MSLLAYERLIKGVEEGLKDKLIASDLEVVMRVLGDVVGDYNVSLNVVEETGTDFMFDAYIEAMQVQGLSINTLRRYKYVIGRLLKELKVTSKNVTVYHLRKFLTSEKDRGICDDTVRGYRDVFSAYFGWLWREGLIPKNPVGNIGTVRVQKKVKKIFTDVEIEKMKLGCTCLRDRAIICFLLSTGCRISEMIGLNRNDIDFTEKECKVLGKGNKERVVYLDDVACMMIKDYLSQRADDNEALFIGKFTERFQAGGVRVMLNRLAKDTGIEHIHPHKFRRTCATLLIKHGMPIQEVAAILGHDKIDTTMRYVVLDKTQVKNSYYKYM